MGHPLGEAHHTGRFLNEANRFGRYPLLLIDEIGYLPFEPVAARPTPNGEATHTKGVRRGTFPGRIARNPLDAMGHRPTCEAAG